MCAMVVGWGGKGEEEVEEEMVDKKGMRMGLVGVLAPGYRYGGRGIDGDCGLVDVVMVWLLGWVTWVYME